MTDHMYTRGHWGTFDSLWWTIYVAVLIGMARAWYLCVHASSRSFCPHPHATSAALRRTGCSRSLTLAFLSSSRYVETPWMEWVRKQLAPPTPAKELV